MRRLSMPAALFLSVSGLLCGCAPSATDGTVPAPVAAPARPEAQRPAAEPSANAQAPEPTPAKAPVQRPGPAPVEAPEPVAAENPPSEPASAPASPSAGAKVTVTITVSGTGKIPAGATVTAICGARQLKVPVGADGVAVAEGLEKGVWSFNVSAPGCYGVVGAVNIDPEESKSYELPVKLDPEEGAAQAPGAAPAGPAGKN